MKIFLATASTQDVEWAAEGGLAEGVVATPALLREAAGEGGERALLAKLCQVAPFPVCASVGSVTSADIYRDGRELAKISDQILVQVPLLEEAVPAIRRLRSDGVRVVATLVYGTAQAVLAAKAGAFMVQIDVEQLDDMGEDGAATLADVRGVFAAHAIECDVAAASPRNSTQFARCVRAGADVVAVTAAVLRALLVHPLTDRGVDRLLSDLSVHSRPRVTV
jgi:transaldolase